MASSMALSIFIAPEITVLYCRRSKSLVICRSSRCISRRRAAAAGLAPSNEAAAVASAVGELRQVSLNADSVPAEGRVVTVMRTGNMVNDVTDRRKAEEELRRSEELFRGIFENTGAGVSLIDATGLFVEIPVPEQVPEEADAG